MDQTRFVIFDTETSGLDMQKDRLLCIAGIALVQNELRVEDSFEIMVRQDDVGGGEAARIHGLVTRDLIDGYPEDEAAARFLDFVGDAVLVAHHAAFDVRMLNKAISVHAGAKVWSPSLDTMRLVERLEQGPMASSPTPVHGRALDAVLERFGVHIDDRHTAAGDALATGLLLQVLLNRARDGGVRTLGDLLGR